MDCVQFCQSACDTSSPPPPEHLQTHKLHPGCWCATGGGAGGGSGGGAAAAGAAARRRRGTLSAVAPPPPAGGLRWALLQCRLDPPWGVQGFAGGPKCTHRLPAVQGPMQTALPTHPCLHAVLTDGTPSLRALRSRMKT
jgi:hypothetical protein